MYINFNVKRSLVAAGVLLAAGVAFGQGQVASLQKELRQTEAKLESSRKNLDTIARRLMAAGKTSSPELERARFYTDSLTDRQRTLNNEIESVVAAQEEAEAKAQEEARVKAEQERADLEKRFLARFPKFSLASERSWSYALKEFLLSVFEKDPNFILEDVQVDDHREVTGRRESSGGFGDGAVPSIRLMWGEWGRVVVSYQSHGREYHKRIGFYWGENIDMEKVKMDFPADEYQNKEFDELIELIEWQYHNPSDYLCAISGFWGYMKSYLKEYSGAELPTDENYWFNNDRMQESVFAMEHIRLTKPLVLEVINRTENVRIEPGTDVFVFYEGNPMAARPKRMIFLNPDTNTFSKPYIISEWTLTPSNFYRVAGKNWDDFAKESPIHLVDPILYSSGR